MKNWKAIQTKKNRPWELYDLNLDLSEAHDIAAEHPEILNRMKQFAHQSHSPVREGTYTTKVRHERDRQAKFGTSGKKPPSKSAGKMNRIKHPNLIAPENIKVLKVSSENKSNDKLVVYAIDGKPDTIWHTQFTGNLKTHPHELILDLGKPMLIDGFRYLARQDGGWNGAFAETEFSISDSPTSFPTSQLLITFQKTKIAQSADLKTPVSGRYVKVRVLSEINQQAWASAAEIGIIAR